MQCNRASQLQYLTVRDLFSGWNLDIQGVPFAVSHQIIISSKVLLRILALLIPGMFWWTSFFLGSPLTVATAYSLPPWHLLQSPIPSKSGYSGFFTMQWCKHTNIRYSQIRLPIKPLCLCPLSSPMPVDYCTCVLDSNLHPYLPLPIGTQIYDWHSILANMYIYVPSWDNYNSAAWLSVFHHKWPTCEFSPSPNTRQSLFNVAPSFPNFQMSKIVPSSTKSNA